MDVKNIIAISYNERIEQASTSLEYEESAKVLANLQGQLAGAKKFLRLLHESFPGFRVIPGPKDDEGKVIPFNLVELSYEALRTLEVDVDLLTTSTEYNALDKYVNHEIESKKEFLFYQAEKGRDLEFTHGFRDGFLHYRDIIKDIRYEAETRSKIAPLFEGEI